jgi:hypothetical protein
MSGKSKRDTVLGAIFKCATFISLSAVLYYGYLSLSLYHKLRDHAPQGYEGLVEWFDFKITVVSALVFRVVKSVLEAIFTPIMRPHLQD